MNLFKKNLYIITFFFISLVIIVIWFHSGKMFAGGEEGVPFYNPARMVNLYNSVWYETGTGYLTPVNIPRFLLFFVLQFLPTGNSMPWISQAIVYFFLLLAAFSSMFYLSKKITKNALAAFFASSFYFLNLYTMSQIWGRFLLTNIFAWAYLPLFLFLWIQLVEEKKVYWILYFLLSSIIFCYTFGQPAMLITLWLPAFLFVVYKLYNFRDDVGEIIKIIIVALVSFFLWILVNIWWFLPYLKLSGVSFSTLTNPKSNLDSLVSVSQYFPTHELILLRQSFLFGTGSSFNYFYSNPFIYFTSIAIFLIVVLGIIISRNKKYWGFVLITFIVAWFLCKGTNPPFGLPFYSILFNFFSFTTSLRNSYEKLGILFVLPYAIFFGIGFSGLFQKIHLAFGSFLLFIFLGILVFPIWTGGVFYNLSVTIPGYYKDANNFLNRQPKGRILLLPFNPGDSAQYKFSDGTYTGLEPSEFLFDKPAVSKIVRADYFDNYYINFYNTFINSKDYDSYLAAMDIKYFVLHNDLNSVAVGASTSAQAKNILLKNPKIVFLRRFGQLDIYKYLGANNSSFNVKGGDVRIISINKFSPTHYTIVINNEGQKYKLIFSETFNKLWQAKIGQTVFPHTLFKSLENSWNISKKGNYTIDVVLKS